MVACNDALAPRVFDKCSQASRGVNDSVFVSGDNNSSLHFCTESRGSYLSSVHQKLLVYTANHFVRVLSTPNIDICRVSTRRSSAQSSRSSPREERELGVTSSLPPQPNTPNRRTFSRSLVTWPSHALTGTRSMRQLQHSWRIQDALL